MWARPSLTIRHTTSLLRSTCARSYIHCVVPFASVTFHFHTPQPGCLTWFSCLFVRLRLEVLVIWELERNSTRTMLDGSVWVFVSVRVWVFECASECEPCRYTMWASVYTLLFEFCGFGHVFHAGRTIHFIRTLQGTMKVQLGRSISCCCLLFQIYGWIYCSCFALLQSTVRTEAKCERRRTKKCYSTFRQTGPGTGKNALKRLHSLNGSFPINHFAGNNLSISTIDTAPSDK